MQSKLFQSALICAGFGLPAFSPIAFAQSESKLPEVVVTANRFELLQSKEPVSMTVISASDIYKSGVQTVQDILFQQAGVNLLDLGGGPNRQIDLRGFGVSGDQNTLILLNGQRLTENELASADLASIPLASIERIEILRGSGAVLFGRGATGGTINIITKQNIDRKNTATVELQGGSFNTLGLVTSASIATDSIGIAIFSDLNATDNYRRNNQLRQQNLTGDLTYWGERGPISLRVSTGNQHLGFPSERTREQLSSDPRGTRTPNDFGDLDTARIALATEQRVNFGYFAVDVTHRTRDSTTFYPSFGMVNPTLTKANVSGISPRLRIPFDVGGTKHSAIVGLDWDRWNWRYLSREVSPDTVDATAHQINQSVYFRHTIDFETGTVLAFGARQQRVITEALMDNPDSQARNISATELALRQALGGGWTLRAKTGSSFRLQTVDELINRFTSELKFLEPQTSNDVEAGISYEQQGNSLAVNVYQSLIKNEIRYFSHPAGFAQSGNFNLPPTSHRGVEATAKWTVSPALFVGLNYAFTEAFFRSGEINGAAVAGKVIPLVPKHKLTASLGWKMLERTNVNARISYVGATRLDGDDINTSELRRPAFTVTDLILNHEMGNWRLKASALNLFNERYFTYGFLSGSSYSGYPAAGRGVFMSAEYRF